MIKQALKKIVRSIRKHQYHYQPLIEIQIDRQRIIDNFYAYTTANRAVAPVLKSNAYGHGLVEVARIVDSLPIPFLCVDSFFEALILRNESVRAPILIIGYTPQENIETNTLPRVAFAIISIEELRRLANSATAPTTIHLKIDTGMHRHGIASHELDEAVTLITKNPFIKLEGIYSHLADADTPQSAITEKQINQWNKAVRDIQTAIPNIAYIHCAASAGSAYPTITANTMRLGLGLYGIPASQNSMHNIQPALKMCTRITSIKKIKKGESVGYNATFIAPADMTIATIPAGYYEGIDRRLSNTGAVLIKNIPCPIVGRVSMNITTIDVSHIKDLSMDDEVVVISKNQSDTNSIIHIARTAGTIPWEILIHIPPHIRRTIA
ncbi:MAG: hypothetical protein RIQ54_383 [Candidatus Parcubacteria bacterium]|jgi:alanine racemase